MKRYALLLTLMLLNVPGWSAPLKIGSLLADPVFAALAPAERLAALNSQLEAKTLKSSELSGDLLSRLFMDALLATADPVARLDRYAALRASNPKLPQSYELEQHLATAALAADPALRDGDELAKLKALLRMENEKKISWPAAAPLYTGMLSLHLAQNPDYLALAPEERLRYLRRLSADGVVKDMTATRFMRGIGWEILSALPAEQQPAALKALEPGLDFFTKSSLGKGYVD